MSLSLAAVTLRYGNHFGEGQVHGKKDPSKHMLFQSVRLVGAVGIEPTTFGLKGRCSTTELRPWLFATFYIETV